MSSDDTRITTDDLLTHATPTDAANLEPMDGHPWEGDVGLAATMSDAFGQTQLVFTHGDTIIWGEEIVRAQLAQPDDGGMVPAVDFAALGWSVERAQTWLLGRLSQQRRGTLDLSDLAELAAGRVTADPELASMAGWDGDQLDDVLNTLAEQQAALNTPAELDDVDPGPPPTDPVTQPGDVWLLGPHRLVCGDCRDADDVEKLLDGTTVNLAFTSPPYADRRKYDETSGFVPISPDEYVEWFKPVADNVAAHLADDGSWFVNIKEHCTDGQRELYVKDLTLAHVRLWGWAFIDEFCWRRSGVPGKWPNRFKNSWEPVFHFARTPAVKLRHDNVTHESDCTISYDPGNPKTVSGFISGSVGGTQGLALPGNVVDVGNAKASKERGHTAEFPVRLPDFFVRAYTDEGDAVFDPFMGSGSTLLAADQNGRVGFGMEISPAYCDVICRRYQTTTGIKPVLESTGEPHDFGV